MLQPLRRDTWAPVGEVPVRYAWDRHDRLSAVCALTVAPWAQRFGMYYDLLDHNVHTADVVQLLRAVHQHLRRSLIVVWDRWRVHRSANARLIDQQAAWLRVHWLPAYAPELDPVEYVWNHAKYHDLANWIPDDIHDLRRHLHDLFEHYRNSPAVLTAFFRRAELIF